jgi:hypothetical protein
MTPYDERFQSYLQIGIAEINPDDNIGEALVQKYIKYNEESSLFILTIIFIFILLFGCTLFVVIRKKREGTLGNFEERAFFEYFQKTYSEAGDPAES